MSEKISRGSWTKHVLRAGTHRPDLDDTTPNPESHRHYVEPWLSALLQAEHLNLLVGNGLTSAVAIEAGASRVDMCLGDFNIDHADAIRKASEQSAKKLGRGRPNVEDQIRAAGELIGGLRVLARIAETGRHGARLPKSAARLLPECESALDRLLSTFLRKVLSTERGIKSSLAKGGSRDRANTAHALLAGFLLPFASRTATRERLHIFTTNYDRLIEYGCDLLGLHTLDRFVGNLEPIFRSSRLGVDLHYNPPGIRGEPRYLEGVVRLTKLHGSLDWRQQEGMLEIRRCGLPFGAPENHPELPERPGDSVLIYPNPAKDVETLEYPYAELFRDFAAAACQPNAVVVTYGYGFGDDHVNRVLRDMLSILSTHLVIISYDSVDGRIQAFCDQVDRDEQITLLIGDHFGGLKTLIEYYLPKPAIDRATWRMMDLLSRRARPQAGEDPPSTGEEEYDDGDER